MAQVYDFQFTAEWDEAIYTGYQGGTPTLEAALRAAVLAMSNIQSIQPGIDVLREIITSEGVMFKVSVARDATAATKYFS